MADRWLDDERVLGVDVLVMGRMWRMWRKI
jgi:hypothetical protein